MLIPSPSLESLGVLCKAKSSPLSWATRCEVLPEGQGVRVCQAGLGGLPSPFLQGLPGLLSGPKNRTKVSGEKGEAESTKPDADPSPPPCSRGQAPQGQMACLNQWCGPRMALSHPLPHPRRDIFRTSERLMLRRRGQKTFSTPLPLSGRSPQQKRQ